MFGFLADLITAVVSILLPVFATYKALRTRDITTLTLWLIYWTTLALVLLAESQLYFFLRWVPLYSWIRLGVYVYLVAPGQKHGSFFIYKEYIHPFLYRHEQQIDQLINEGNTRAFTLGWELVTRGIGFVQAQVLAYNQSRFEMHPGRQPSFSNFEGRRQIPAWDRRHSGRGSRFEELESEHDEYNSYAPRELRRRPLPEDELFFDGSNSRQYRQRRKPGYDGQDDLRDYDSDEEEYYRRARSIEYQAAVRDKEDTLIQSALSRIARARARGKSSANLSPEESEALERRNIQQPESPAALVTPPATPTTTKAKLATKSGAKSSSSSKEISKSSKKKHGSPSKSSSKSKTERKTSSTERMAEHALPYAAGTTPQGIMVPGPNGVPVYAPLVYGAPDQSRTSKSRSRSISKHARRESTPPENYTSSRYYPPAAVRPTSAASNRSLPDDPDWMPTRRSQTSMNGQYNLYRASDGYDVPPLPAAQGRRHASGPADVQYGSPRRSGPMALGRPAGPAHSNSDPSTAAAKRSGLSRELTEATSSDSSDSSDDSDDNGAVQVNVNVESGSRGGGYSINRAPATVAISNRRKASQR